MIVDHHISEELNLLRNTLAAKFQVRQIILFGSFAYGNPNVDSDIDVCVIADFSGRRKIEVIREIRRELTDLILSSLDILLYQEHEFKERAALSGSLEYKILHQGVLLYERFSVCKQLPYQIPNGCHAERSEESAPR